MRCPNIAPERKGFCIVIMPTTKSTPETTAALSGPENTANAAPAEESRLEPGATPRVGFSNAGKIARFALQRAGEKKLTQVASSLTFTTVLAIVPLLAVRSEEHTSELQSLMRISYAVFRLKKKKKHEH